MRVSNSDIDRIYVNIATRTKEYKFNMPDNHFHQYYELYYCKSSTCSYFVNNRILELHSGDFLLVPPREMHYTKYNSATPCTRINIYFKYSNIAFIRLKNGFGGSSGRNTRIILFLSKKEIFYWMYLFIYRIYYRSIFWKGAIFKTWQFGGIF